MARVVASVEVAAPAPVVWNRVVDWPAHGRWVPLTRVRVLTSRPGGVGARFVGRTGLGPLGFDDPMEVVEWTVPSTDRPGVCDVVKQGRVVLGRARFEVAPTSSGTTTVRWTEDIELAPVRLTRPFGRLVALGGRLLFSRALRIMAREVEAEQRGERAHRG